MDKKIMPLYWNLINFHFQVLRINTKKYSMILKRSYCEAKWEFFEKTHNLTNFKVNNFLGIKI